MSQIYESLAKGFYLQGMLPLDAKGVFSNLTFLKDLGTDNSKAFTYYEYMKVLCQEDGNYYIWKEVSENSDIGVLDENFQYPENVISDYIDYSNRYFNFVLEEKSQSSSAIAKPYLIMKDWPNNTGDYLEINDVVRGHFATDKLMEARYKGGSIIDINSWAIIEAYNPKLYS
tara:strand:- start:58913 stop:59428 length:516 start_codon:yes stop_codon:yes gene_type:complete